MKKIADNDHLASEGKINPNASVKASCKMETDAKAEYVWELLSDINRWPMWMNQVSEVQLDGPIKKGASFDWKNNGVKIRSVIRQVEPGKKLAWTGSVLWVKAIHTWQIDTTDNGKTRVSTAESMEGFFCRFIFPSHKLKKTLESWLHDLKRAAES
ncbi:MAG: SRPBCC family protein [Balneolaceae bacterium]|nr:SRPBCC family protein [Balneolaceae bacterium]